ncbi:glycosyltransferase [Chitinophaga sp. RAB17]|uniref:glycosyltransferase n=1 Tax=Chitinophaga sp. RAB17 TaxID=3233049 RepID=UPI003F8F6A1F
MKSLNNSAVKLEWMTSEPATDRRIAMLIPQYNEGADKDFEQRLEYFKMVADKHREQLDIILIDDGSTNDSLEKMNLFLAVNPGAFYLASVYPNANKVGALFLTTLSISHEFVVLSDFDTDINGLEKLPAVLDNFRSDDGLMGCYFRMLPFEGSGNIFLYQQLEYSLHRSIYRYHEKEQSIRVMPGAGSCYRRDALVAIYRQHSGLRSGEDREATLIGLKMGYKTFYLNTVLALTRPPLSDRALITQRIRWNIGYLETFYKEGNYYLGEIWKFSRIGMITIVDFFSLVFLLLFPVIALVCGIAGGIYLLLLLVSIYVVQLGWCLNLLWKAPEESHEFRAKKLISVLLYPVIKFYIDYFAWNRAFILFISNIRKLGKKAVNQNKSKNEIPTNINMEETPRAESIKDR